MPDADRLAVARATLAAMGLTTGRLTGQDAGVAQPATQGGAPGDAYEVHAAGDRVPARLVDGVSRAESPPHEQGENAKRLEALYQRGQGGPIPPMWHWLGYNFTLAPKDLSTSNPLCDCSVIADRSYGSEPQGSGLVALPRFATTPSLAGALFRDIRLVKRGRGM